MTEREAEEMLERATAGMSPLEKILLIATTLREITGDEWVIEVDAVANVMRVRRPNA